MRCPTKKIHTFNACHQIIKTIQGNYSDAEGFPESRVLGRSGFSCACCLDLLIVSGQQDVGPVHSRRFSQLLHVLLEASIRNSEHVLGSCQLFPGGAAYLSSVGNRQTVVSSTVMA